MILILWILNLITFASFRAKRLAARRRRTYEAIRKLIEAANDSEVGFIEIDHMSKKPFVCDLEDVLGFGPPMYKIYRGHNRKCFISWDLKKMNEERKKKKSPDIVVDDIE